MIQKDRVYELILGDTRTGNAVQIDTSLEIKFHIKKGSHNKKHHNAMTIEVYNLNADHIALLQSDFITCRFSVGYKETGPLLLVAGNVVESGTRKEGVDFITKVVVGEAYTDLNHTKLNTVVAPGKTVRNAITTIAAQMPNVSVGALTGDGLNTPLMFGLPMYGSPKMNLDRITEAHKMEWQVTAGVLHVSDENGLLTTNQTLAPIVNKDTGLLEVPFDTTARGNQLPKDKKRKKGVKFKALLNAEYNPGYIVKLESQFINGFYRIDTATFKGDFRGNDWYVECFCSDINSKDLT